MQHLGVSLFARLCNIFFRPNAIGHVHDLYDSCRDGTQIKPMLEPMVRSGHSSRLFTFRSSPSLRREKDAGRNHGSNVIPLRDAQTRPPVPWHQGTVRIVSRVIWFAHVLLMFCLCLLLSLISRLSRHFRTSTMRRGAVKATHRAGATDNTIMIDPH